MQPDNSPHIVVPAVVAAVLTIQPVRADQFLIAADVLSSLSQAGVDWTVVDREVLLGGGAIAGTTIGPILPQHIAGLPIVEVDGSQQVNNWIVKGDGTGPGGVSVASGPIADGVTYDSASVTEYGLLEAVTTAKVSTDEAALANAQSRLALSKDPLVIVREVRLLPSAPFPISTLIAGVTASLNLQAVCDALPGNQRIQRVGVVMTDRGEEQVVLTFMPPGSS